MLQRNIVLLIYIQLVYCMMTFIRHFPWVVPIPVPIFHSRFPFPFSSNSKLEIGCGQQIITLCSFSSHFKADIKGSGMYLLGNLFMVCGTHKALQLIVMVGVIDDQSD